MTANELIDKIEKIQNNRENIDWYVLQFVVPMLRKQQAEIEALKKELALQRLSDIGQIIESPVGPNWWKGDPTCGGIAENYMSKKASDK